jgi:hypothetical protein
MAATSTKKGSAPTKKPAAAAQTTTDDKTGPAATVLTALNTMADVMDAWSTATSVISSLKLAGAKIFDEASADAKKSKHHTKLSRERARFDAAVSDLDQTSVEGLRAAFLLEQELAYDSVSAQGQVAEHQAGVASVLTALRRSLMDGAKLAHAYGDRVRAGTFTSMAEQAKDAGVRLDRGAEATAKAGVDHRGNLATATTFMDTGNNVGPGLVGCTIGGIEAATQPILTGATSSATADSPGAAGVFDGLGILFGSIGVALGVKAPIRRASSEKELKALKPSVTNADLGDATDYMAGRGARRRRAAKPVPSRVVRPSRPAWLG